MLRIVEPADEVLPFDEVGFGSLNREMVEHQFVESLFLHLERHLVDGVCVDGLDDMPRLHIAEERDFLAEFRREVVLGAADDDVRLHAALLKHLHAVLGRLGLELLGGLEIRHEGEVYRNAVFLREFPLKLTHGLNERMRLHVSDRSADFGDDDIVVAGLREQHHPALDFVRDVRDNLHCLAQIRALAFLAYHGVVNLARGDIVRLGSIDSEKALVVPEVEVCLRAVLSDIALAVLVRVERARVDVDVGVEFLDCDLQTPRLKKFCERCGNDSLSEGGCDTACDEDVLCVHWKPFWKRASLPRV